MIVGLLKQRECRFSNETLHVLLYIFICLYINVKTGPRDYSFYCILFLRFSYSRSYIHSDDGYICTAETCICFYTCGKGCVSTVIILILFIYDT